VKLAQIRSVCDYHGQRVIITQEINDNIMFLNQQREKNLRGLIKCIPVEDLEADYIVTQIEHYRTLAKYLRTIRKWIQDETDED
jgi:hypothetical protein